MMDWFRSHHGAPTDPKWRTIAKRAGVLPGMVVSLAWALLDDASQAVDRGSMAGADLETLADFMGYELADVERVVSAMVDKGVLSGGRFAAWERRQPKREDDGAADRKRAQRERDKAKVTAAERDASGDDGAPRDPSPDTPRPAPSQLVTPGHAASRIVTTEQSRAEQNRTEAGRPAHAHASAPACEAPGEGDAAPPARPPALDDGEFEREACHLVACWPEPKGSFRQLLALDVDRERALAILRDVVSARRDPVGSWRLWAEIIAEKASARPRGRRGDPAASVFVVKGTPEWHAWSAQRQAEGKRNCPVSANPADRSQEGWHFPSLWPPGKEPQGETVSIASL